MYYAIEINSSFFLSGSFGGLSGCLPLRFSRLSSGCHGDVFILLDADLSSLFIVEETPYRV
jgi:hypothetical protein